jgi:uncharacterized integral membrane protein
MTYDEQPVSTTPGQPRRGKRRGAKRSRVSGVWIGMILVAIFLIILIVFIAQNLRRVPVHFLGWHAQFPLALTILLAAVIGLLLVAIPGSVRILQLRRTVRKTAVGTPGPTVQPAAPAPQQPGPPAGDVSEISKDRYTGG